MADKKKKQLKTILDRYIVGKGVSAQSTPQAIIDREKLQKEYERIEERKRILRGADKGVPVYEFHPTSDDDRWIIRGRLKDKLTKSFSRRKNNKIIV